VGAAGPPHHGVLDLSFLRCVPGVTVAAPKDGNELRDLLWTALSHDGGPFAIRFPRDSVPAGFDPSREPEVLPTGSWEILETGGDVAILAVGTMVQTALAAGKILAESGVRATVVNARFVKPMDRAVLERVRQEARLIVTVEENNLPGGFGAGVLDELETAGLTTDGVIRLGLPDDYVGHGTRGELLEEVGLTPERIAEAVVRARSGR
jgi:1-deoxy-D-xylulose-5-phosphate synthase